MDAQDYLFYGYGQIVYAIALADGKVQKEEHRLLHQKVDQGLKTYKIDFDYAGIVFDILDDEKVFTSEDTYTEGLKNMKLGSHKLTPELKTIFGKILEDVAESFPPVTSEEKDYLTRFKSDIESL